MEPTADTVPQKGQKQTRHLHNWNRFARPRSNHVPRCSHPPNGEPRKCWDGRPLPSRVRSAQSHAARRGSAFPFRPPRPGARNNMYLHTWPAAADSRCCHLLASLSAGALIRIVYVWRRGEAQSRRRKKKSVERRKPHPVHSALLCPCSWLLSSSVRGWRRWMDGRRTHLPAAATRAIRWLSAGPRLRDVLTCWLYGRGANGAAPRRLVPR
jgi:hypothetical protein